ncbi:Peroxisomal membrane signal receptor PTS1 [Elasticomyces elasticus]|nr:Peroxisomal membrane signal receptor PTS1 [Elasticomyces elasticus]KAK4975793.1 Peroxisomal membrane signal receptor PTS1 [Elasticomyces elasticus]
MSFLGGPECSTGANPLAQFQKQSSADTSLQRDRLTQRPTQLNGFRNQQLPDDAQFQEFQQQGPGFNEQLPQDANYQQQLFLLEQQQQQQARAGGGDGWAGEFAQQPPTFSPEQFAQQQGRNGAFSPQDFPNFRQQQMSPASRQAQTPVPQQQSLYQRPPMYGSTFGGSGFGMQRPMMFQPQQPMYGQQPQEQYQGKGKGRIQELSDTDWEEQFKELSTVDKEGELDQLDADAEQAIEAELNQMDRYVKPLPFDLASCDPALILHCGVGGQHGNKMVRDAGFGEFEDIWQGYQAEANVARDMLGDEGHMGEYDEWKDFDGMSHDFDGLRTFENRGPESSNYLFEENNLFDDVPNAFEEGLKIMREGGSLSLAALAFEAAVQKQPEMVEAWVALGSAQAQNEKESPAIRAMEQALKLDSNNLDALMGLSVSYTNEGYDSLAYRTLERWVSVKYPQLGLTPQGLDAAAQAEEEMGFTDRHQLHEKVTALFLEAAQLNPEGMDVDIDVQVGLGVLFYGSEDYDKAVDCFNAALDSAETGTMKREGEEHLLWNRLGATLANSGRSEEAIEAYSRALELRSNFVRARYNLGVSCINLGVLEQAAGHLLGALSMHRVIEREGRMKAAELLRDGNGNAVDDREVEGLLQQNQSTNLYDTLRRVFTQMDRRDLSEGEESESVSQPQVYAKVLRGDIVSDAETAKARWAIPNEAGGFDFADSVSLPQKPLGRLSVDILSGGGGSVVGIENAQLMVGYEAGESESAEVSPSHGSYQEGSSEIRHWGTSDRGETVYWTGASIIQGEGLSATTTMHQPPREKTLLGLDGASAHADRALVDAEADVTGSTDGVSGSFDQEGEEGKVQMESGSDYLHGTNIVQVVADVGAGEGDTAWLKSENDQGVQDEMVLPDSGAEAATIVKHAQAAYNKIKAVWEYVKQNVEIPVEVGERFDGLDASTKTCFDEVIRLAADIGAETMTVEATYSAIHELCEQATSNIGSMAEFLESCSEIPLSTRAEGGKATEDHLPKSGIVVQLEALVKEAETAYLGNKGLWVRLAQKGTATENMRDRFELLDASLKADIAKAHGLVNQIAVEVAKHDRASADDVQSSMDDSNVQIKAMLDKLLAFMTTIAPPMNEVRQLVESFCTMVEAQHSYQSLGAEILAGYEGVIRDTREKIHQSTELRRGLAPMLLSISNGKYPAELRLRWTEFNKRSVRLLEEYPVQALELFAHVQTLTEIKDPQDLQGFKEKYERSGGERDCRGDRVSASEVDRKMAEGLEFAEWCLKTNGPESVHNDGPEQIGTDLGRWIVHCYEQGMADLNEKAEMLKVIDSETKEVERLFELVRSQGKLPVSVLEHYERFRALRLERTDEYMSLAGRALALNKMFMQPGGPQTGVRKMRGLVKDAGVVVQTMLNATLAMKQSLRVAEGTAGDSKL